MGTFRYIGTAALIGRGLSALEHAVRQSAEDLVGQAMPLARVDTGALRAGIHVDAVVVTSTSVTARVSTGGETDEYSIYQHEGTRYMSGTHFIEIPLIENTPVYLAHIKAAAAAAY